MPYECQTCHIFLAFLETSKFSFHLQDLHCYVVFRGICFYTILPTNPHPEEWQSQRILAVPSPLSGYLPHQWSLNLQKVPRCAIRSCRMWHQNMFHPFFSFDFFFQRCFFQLVFRPSWEGLICHFQCVQPHPHAALELIASRAFAKPMEGSLDSGRRHPAHHIPTNRWRPLSSSENQFL